MIVCLHYKLSWTDYISFFQKFAVKFHSNILHNRLFRIFLSFSFARNDFSEEQEEVVLWEFDSFRSMHNAQLWNMYEEVEHWKYFYHREIPNCQLLLKSWNYSRSISKTDRWFCIISITFEFQKISLYQSIFEIIRKNLDIGSF